MVLPEKLMYEAAEKYGKKFMFAYKDHRHHLSYEEALTGGYERSPQGYYGICTACKSRIELDDPPPSEDEKQRIYYGSCAGYDDFKTCIGIMECPYCDAEVEIKKGWYGKKSLKDRFYLQAWEVVSFDKVILHEAIVCCDDWSQWEEYDGPKYIYKYDLRSTELTPGKTVTTRWSGKQFKNSHTASDYEKAGLSITFGQSKMNDRVCYYNIDALRDSFLRPLLEAIEDFNNSEVKQLAARFAGARNYIELDDMADYLFRMNEEPITELLFKAGFYTIVQERVYHDKRNTSRNTRHIMFDVRSPKKMFRGLSQNHADERMKRMMRLIEAPAHVSIDDLEGAAELFRVSKSAKPEDMAKIISKGEFRAMSKIYKVLPYFPEARINEYIAKSKWNPQYYLDYLEAADAAGAPLNERRTAFPEDLTDAHDEAVRKREYKVDPVAAAKCHNRHNKLIEAGYEYEWRGIIAIIPDTPSEIIAEGKILRHCVGEYADRHTAGNTNIIFIRHTGSNSSWFTLEVDPKTLKFKQCYGYKNQSTGIQRDSMCKNYNPVVGEFLKHYKRRLKWAKEHKKEMKKLCRITA